MYLADTGTELRMKKECRANSYVLQIPASFLRSYFVDICTVSVKKTEIFTMFRPVRFCILTIITIKIRKHLFNIPLNLYEV